VNVLEMRGPTFLLLYGLVAIMTCIAVWGSIRQRETRAGASPLRIRDPYEIAYLRGGTQELVKVVTLALMRRGLIAPMGASLQATAADTAVAAADIERAVLATCRSATPAHLLAGYDNIRTAALRYHEALTDKHLMPDAVMLRARLTLAAVALASLGGFALAKIAHALYTGHSNIELLICLVVVSAVALFKIARHPRTADGDRALGHLDVLFGRVKRGPRPIRPDQLNEALLLAAVYGDYARPGAELSAWRRLFPDPKRNQNSDGGSGGCGSSGCGGGGGCGGCGS
jgi:uncharacterized protein (TIGR04222 family)